MPSGTDATRGRPDSDDTADTVEMDTVGGAGGVSPAGSHQRDQRDQRDRDNQGHRDHRPAHRWLARLIELLAVLPAVAVAVEVAAGPRLQLLDYWHVLLRITNPDGSLNFSGLWILQNEHPLMLPSLFYWLDARLFAGDKRALGVVVIVFAALTVLLLRAALPTTLPPLVRAGLVFASSALVFSLHGLHNFVLGMSGTAWLLANLLVVSSLLLAARDRWWASWLVGLLACMSYGTAFALWPALALLATMGRQRWWRRLVPLGIGAAVVVTWLLLRPGVDAGTSPTSDVGTLLYTFLTVVGHLWTGKTAGVAVVAGTALLLCYAALATVPAARTPGARLWWALGVYAILASGMIAAARIDFGLDFGLSSRYTSLSVLASVPVLVLLGTLAYHARSRDNGFTGRMTLAALAVGVLGFALGAPSAASVRSAMADVPMQAVAIRIGVTDDMAELRLPTATALTERLDAMDHYPFTDDFTLGCDGPELGSTLDLAAMDQLPQAEQTDKDAPSGWVDRVEDMGDAVVVNGWATSADDPVRCAVLVDGTGEVIGGGDYHRPRPDVAKNLDWVPTEVGFQVVGPADRPEARVVVILDSGRMLWLPPTTADED